MASRQLSPDTPATSSTPTPVLLQSTLDDCNLKPCSHLAQVLGTSAKDTVLRNYTGAYRVSILNNVTQFNPPQFRIIKTKSKLDKSKILQLKSHSPKCTQCANVIGKNFYCLQCAHVGCWNKQHFVDHAKAQGHVFGIDSQTGLLFCFKCSCFISDPSLDFAREEIDKSCNTPLGNTNAAAASPANDSTGVIATKKGLIVPDEEDLKLIAKYSKTVSGKASTGLRGFVNMGSTCFMSTILQTFIHNPIIRDYFLTEGHSKCGKLRNECITCCVDEIFINFFTSNDRQGYGPVSFLNAAWRKNKLLAGYSQQDAHEFWQFLVNQLHQDLKPDARKPSDPHFRCQCVAHQCFASDLQSSIKCSQCGTITTTVDPIIDISLDITHSDDLKGCFHNFVKTEKLDIKYSCNNCQERTPASKKLSILKFPNVLAIQLKRFEHSNQSSKIDKYVSFPFYMDMNPYSTSFQSTGVSDPALNYELFAIVCHIGTVNTGHYIVCIKDSQGRWWKFDDSVVVMLSREEVQNMKAYLLFYGVHKLA
ncbi:hypothetical protein WICPIJ_000282 [Wickerhamomyces pijperi]|uniref:Ubiquitinyl hydrolase 1 n=1 Tax=Wickerhamomyces pijperi TaxID=599730 RepID=A0A9P8TQZ6_WICPI|nr:hypothetical protein WICPIJ_000282 [Wickerhamomyces pijperi]